jgi:two-component system OmpR family response regulator
MKTLQKFASAHANIRTTSAWSAISRIDSKIKAKRGVQVATPIVSTYSRLRLIPDCCSPVMLRIRYAASNRAMLNIAPAPRDMMDFCTRLLIVDDDSGIRELTTEFLIQHGFVVDAVPDGTAMRAALVRHYYDLIILDVMMPGEDGLSILRSLDRTNGPAIIMHSVIGQEVDRIVGLELGADDYLAKPANPRELLARIRAVLRRGGNAPFSVARGGAFFRFSGWRIDPAARELFDPDDVLINLTDGEFRLLLTLIEHSRRVLSRDFMLDHSRGTDTEQFDRAIDVQISRLRRKLARSDGRGGEELIRTVRNEGYMFTADVERS